MSHFGADRLSCYARFHLRNPGPHDANTLSIFDISLTAYSYARLRTGLAASSRCRADNRQARIARQTLGGGHGQAAGGYRWRMTFTRGGNAVDAACAMLAATSTMWDTLGWGGETQALIYNPNTGEVKGINALGVAPTGATAEFFREQGMLYPPEYGPLAAVTPGTPGGLMVMLAEYGQLSLAEVLAPAMQMAEGYPIEKSQADNMERRKDVIAQWSYSTAGISAAFERGRQPGARGAASRARTSASLICWQHCKNW